MHTLIYILSVIVPILVILAGLAAVVTMCVVEGYDSLMEKKRDNARFICETNGNAWHQAMKGYHNVDS